MKKKWRMVKFSLSLYPSPSLSLSLCLSPSLSASLLLYLSLPPSLYLFLAPHPIPSTLLTLGIPMFFSVSPFFLSFSHLFFCFSTPLLPLAPMLMGLIYSCWFSRGVSRRPERLAQIRRICHPPSLLHTGGSRCVRVHDFLSAVTEFSLTDPEWFTPLLNFVRLTVFIPKPDIYLLLLLLWLQLPWRPLSHQRSLRESTKENVIITKLFLWSNRENGYYRAQEKRSRSKGQRERASAASHFNQSPGKQRQRSINAWSTGALYFSTRLY